MMNVRQHLRHKNGAADVNISPLIDLVFLLLIFFMVTTSFVRETAVSSESSNILVAVTDQEEVYFDGQRVDVRTVRNHVARAIAENPGAEVIVVADKHSQTGIVVQVMDQCRMAGADRVSLAAAESGAAH
jgi:biopolymer transport protein ExbD